MRFLGLMRVTALVASLLLCWPSYAALQQKPGTSGMYRDRNGREYRWTIGPSHTLTWDGQPYVPVGVRFIPRVLAEGFSEENWASDVADLQLIKSKGIGDLIIDPVVSAARISPEVWQRLIDHLEQEGFRYGIAFGSGVDAELTGMVVNPSAYRIADLAPGSEARWDVTDVLGGWYVVADARDGTQIVGEGKAMARSGRVAITISSRSADTCVALLYPRKSLRPTYEGSLPDVWSGFDTYRDRLLQVLGQVRFGPGLRFFLDPLGERVGLPGEADYLVPDTPAWRLEWEAFLARKYPTPTAVAVAWGLLDRELSDYRLAASLVPLWFRNKGVPFLLDPGTGKRYQVSGAESRFWQDFRECRDEGLTYCLRTMADVLKREIAEVPVVYTYSTPHRMFQVGAEPGGMDGIGVAAYGSGMRLIHSGTDSAFSQVTDSARHVWFLATEVSDPTGSGGQPGYATRESLHRDLDWLAGAGIQGFFLRGARVPPDRKSLNADLLAQPEVMEWLRAYGARVVARGSAPAGPRILPYPSAASGYVQSGPIGNTDIWWLPSLAPGKALDFGRLYAGYVITLPEGETTVLWSTSGARDTRLYVPDPRRLQVVTPDGVTIPVRMDMKNRVVQLVVPETPILIRAQGQQVFPIDTIADALQQVRDLIAQAQAQKVPVQDVRYLFDAAEARFRRKDMVAAFGLAQQAMAAIVELMQPYAWREVEHAAIHTFTEVVPTEGASQGMYLSLNTNSAPPRDGYSFQLRFRVMADDKYTVWLACSPPSPTSSPFAWVVDTGETRLSSEAEAVGNTYLGDRLIWMRLGDVSLKAGEHTFTLRVTDRATATGYYSFAADVLLVTRMPFTPRGTARPSATMSRP